MMIRPRASTWSNLRRRARPKSSPSARRRPTSWPSRLESLERITLLSNFIVTSAGDSGAGSLRSAITASNAATGQFNTIHFNIPGTGVEKIALVSALPVITQPVVIDATSITGYTTTPLIELDGTNTRPGTNGLMIAASATGTIVKGLDVHSFGGDGIDVSANSVTLGANFIGTDPTGLIAAPNRGSGVVVRGSSGTIGGVDVLNADGTPQVMGGNLISGNTGNGVVIAGAFNVVEGNWIGVDSTGKSALGNALDGVVVDGVSSNTVGGATAGTRNVISGNLGQGVSIANIPAPPPTTYSTSAGPLTLTQAGINAGFSLSNFATGFPSLYNIGPLGNAFLSNGGVLVSSYTAAVYKFPTDTDGQVATAVPKYSSGYGTGDIAQIGSHIYMPTGPTSGVYEIDSSGKVIRFIAGVPNSYGMVVDTAPGALFDHLLVMVGKSGSNPAAIYDVDPVANTSKVALTLPFGGDGLVFDPSSNTLYVAWDGYGVVGYNMSTKQKVFDSGHLPSAYDTSDGISIGSGDLRNELFVNTNQGAIVEVSTTSPSTYTVIASGGSRGDFAIVDPNNGTFLLSQTDRIVRLSPPLGSSFKGGPPPTTSRNVVEGNLIGLGSDGVTVAANGNNGVMVSAGAAGNTIGGASAGQGNLIAGNKGNGVALVDPSTKTNSVVGNSIGTDALGNLAAGNLGDGVSIAGGGSANQVSGNTIAHNGQDGVGVDASSPGNAIQTNRIFGNQGQGINLGTGSNPVQGFPTLTAAYGSLTATYVGGTAPGPSGSSVTLDFYANTAEDPSGHGQGQFYLGQKTVAAGASFQALLPRGANPGLWLSATATSASEGTSGFAADVVVQKAATTATLTSAAGPSTYGQGVVFSAAYTSGAPVVGGVQFQVDGVNAGPAVAVDPTTGIATSPSITSLNVGTDTVTAVYFGDSLHDPLTTSIVQSVNKAHLTVTADPKWMLYGAAPPTLSATISGFVNGDNSGVVSGAASLGTTATAASPIGPYPITVGAGTLSAANYDFPNLVNGVLSVIAPLVNDFTGAGHSDPVVFRQVKPWLIDWFIQGDPTLTGAGRPFGAAKLDVPLIGDFDGDGKPDLAVYRPSTAQWFVEESSNNYAPPSTYFAFFGQVKVDVPVPGDFNGTGTTVPAVFRPTTGQWFIDAGGNGPNITEPVTFPAGSAPVPGNYDNVGRDEAAVFNPKTSQWIVESPGATSTHVVAQLGSTGDVPVPGAYDALTTGNPAVEAAIWRPATGRFFIQGPHSARIVQFAVGDIPAPGDYDGIGETEAAVYRPSTSHWLVVGPNDKTPRDFAYYGGPNDAPTAAPYAYRALESGGGLISKFSVASPASVDLGSTALAFAAPAVARPSALDTRAVSPARATTPRLHALRKALAPVPTKRLKITHRFLEYSGGIHS